MNKDLRKEFLGLDIKKYLMDSSPIELKFDSMTTISSSLLKVTNKYKPTQDLFRDPEVIYIGRGSPLGNPYTHLKSKFPDVIHVKTREEAVKNYELTLRAELSLWMYTGHETPKVKAFIDIMHRLRNGIPVNLECFCAPKLCHGHAIQKLVSEYFHYYNMLKDKEK